MKLRCLPLVFLILSLISDTCSQLDDDPQIVKLEQDGANYLHDVMVKIQKEREESQEVVEMTNIINMDRVSESAPGFTSVPNFNGHINGPTPVPPLHEQVPISPPPPALTAEELKAIYQAALQKGVTLSQAQQGPFNANASPGASQNLVVQPESQGVADSYPGYYYYFYPIKSFQTTADTSAKPSADAEGMKPPAAANSSQMTEQGTPPLFMAVSSFMGMAMMFIVSVLFLPKFGHIRSDSGPETKESPHELAVLGKLVFETLDGRDCTERMACEMGRVVRGLRMGKLVKIMEILLPPNVSRQMGMIRKAAVKNEKCNFIPCRFKSERPPAKKNPAKPWKKGPSPHELWMKHFEKGKVKKKKPETAWNKNKLK